MALLVAVAALLSLIACSGPTTSAAKVGTPEFYWYAAKETYAAGDYTKTLDHLDHLIADHNEYSARALPWSLVVTSGVAAGYMELADDYTAGARINKANAAVFHRKAADYRAMASPLVLRFAQNVDKIRGLPSGAIALAFSLPKGAAAAPALLKQIASGIPLAQPDADEVQALVIDRNVLLSACLTAGAPNDAARAAEVLGHASAITPRMVFAHAISDLLEKESTLFSREKLDDPDKKAALHQRAQDVLTHSAQTSASVTMVTAKAQ
jgi:hypothetical protein